MQKIITTIALLMLFQSAYQQQSTDTIPSVTNVSDSMPTNKKVEVSQSPSASTLTADNGDPIELLKNFTFGIALGYGRTFERPNDYSLTPQKHLLEVQPLARGAFVLSSTISFKLRTTAVGVNNNRLYYFDTSSNRYTIIRGFFDKVLDRLAINASLNLVELGNGDVSFNKNIDGGLGVGFHFNEFAQLAVFYDIKFLRQLRQYYVTTYTGKPIPTGEDSEVLNALDPTDDNLFYNKSYSGVSIKLVLTISSKK